MDHSELSIIETNQHAWAVPSRVAKYGGLQGWIDDGERIAVNSIADEVRGQPVLDIGVGTGRTAWLVRLLTDDYVAIDWSAEMVETCRAMYPGLDVRKGDARDLSDFAPSHFKLVLFSYNGLDNLDRAGRLRVYDQVRRIIRPDGIFAYSTFSKDGHMYAPRPWFRGPGAAALRRVAPAFFDAPRQLLKHPLQYADWRKSYRSSEEHGDWGLAPVVAVDFNLAHFTSADGERRALTEHGFIASDIFASTGERVSGSSAGSPWFFVVARPRSGMTL
jgi:SAM-dependent methyltransferase